MNETILVPYGEHLAITIEMKKEIARLTADRDEAREQLQEAWTDSFCASACYIRKGHREGWYDSCCMSDAVYYGDLLVEHHRWIKADDGHGRRQFYKRPSD